MSQSYVATIEARNASWQVIKGVQIQSGQTAIITASGTWGVIDPRNRGYCGPSGDGVNGTGDIVEPGAPEGALLVHLADGEVYAFPPSNVLTVGIPGQLAFIANDYQNTGAGFTDNKGYLIVNILIQDPQTKLDKVQLAFSKENQTAVEPSASTEWRPSIGKPSSSN